MFSSKVQKDKYESILEIMKELDTDNNNMISQQEFSKVIQLFL